MKRHLILFLVLSCSILVASAQQRIGDGSVGSNKLPHKDAILELESKNKALLMTRIALVSTTAATPLSVHTLGMVAYNTATVGDVVPGIYYNDGTKWILVGKGETSNIKYDASTYIISYVDASGNPATIDIKGIVKGTETITKVVAEVKNGKNTGRYTYYNEKDIDLNGDITVGSGTMINVVGDVQNNFQEIISSTEVKNILNQIITNNTGTVSYNSATNSFTYVDGNGVTQTINIKDIITANETETILENKGKGKYTYTNEKGKTVDIDVVGDVQNNFQQLVSNTEVKNIIENIVKNTSGNVSYNSATNSFTYVDGNGATQTINIKDIITSNETETILENKGKGKYTYTNEKGKTVDIDVVGDVQSNFQQLVSNTEVKNIIENTSGNVSYNSVTNSFTYVDGNGATQTININEMVRGNETVTKVVAEVVNGKNTGRYTYYNEKDIDRDGNITGAGTVINVVGDVQNNFQQLVSNTEVKNIIENIVKNTGGNVSYNSATNSFTYVDGNGATQTINIKDIITANQKNTTVTNGTYTTLATTTPNANTTNYQLDLSPTAIAGAGLKLNTTTGKLDVDITTIPNASDKTATVAAGTNTSIATNVTNPNHPIYTVNVATANGTNLGVVKEAATNPTVNIANDGSLSVNTTALQNNQKTSSVVSGTTTTVTSATSGNNTAYTVEINPSSVQSSQKTSSVTGSGLATVTSSLTGNNTAYNVDVTVGSIQSSQKLATLSNGTNTTVASTISGNTTDYKVSVATANGTNLGVVKEASTNPTVKIINGELSVNLSGTGTPTDPGAGKNFSSTDLDITNGNGATLTTVTANIKNGIITPGKLANSPSANQILVTNGSNIPSWADQSTLITGNQKNTVVTSGTYTTLATTTPNANTTNYQLDVSPTALAGAGLKLNTVTGKIDVDINTIPNASDKTATLQAGTNTTLTTDNTNPNNPIYKVNVATANGGSLGVVKEASTSPTVKINANGELSINLNGTGTPTDPGAGKNLTSNDLTITGGTGATLTTVTADIKADAVTMVKIAPNAVTTVKLADANVTAAKLTAGAGAAGRVAIANAAGAVSYGTLPATSITGSNMTSSDLSITGGTGATLTTVTADIKANAVTTAKLADANVTAAKLTAGAGAAGRVAIANAAGAVSYGTLPATSVTGSNMTSSDLTITGGTGATLTTVTADIKADAVTTVKIAPNAVTTVKLADANVTAAKLTAGAGTAGRVAIADAAGAVSYGALPATSVTGADVTAGSSKVALGGTPTGAVLKPFTIDVATANGTTLGVVKEAASTPTVKINAGGELSIDATNVATGLGQNFTSADLTITGGIGATLKAVSAVIAPDAVTSAKIKDGEIINADIAAAANVAVTKLASGGNSKVLTTNTSGVPNWADQNTLAVSNIYSADGNLANDRVVNLNGHSLNFKSTAPEARETIFDHTNGASFTNATTTGRANIRASSGNSTLDLYQDLNSAAQLVAGGSSTKLVVGTAGSSATPLELITNGSTRLHVSGAGKVGIGTTNMLSTSDANVLLAVNGSIETANSTYADYVFEDYFNGISELKKDYNFKSLKEVEAFINENKHLPGVKSVKGLRQNERGEYIFNMSALSIQMLEKVEELYLHTIEQQKQLEAKDKEIETLKTEQRKMEARLKRLEEAILAKEKK